MRPPRTATARWRHHRVLVVTCAISALLAACATAAAAPHARTRPGSTLVRGTSGSPWNPSRRIEIRERVVAIPPPPPHRTKRPVKSRPAPASRVVTTRPVKTHPASAPPLAPGLVSERVTVVGDSVTLDAAPALVRLIPHCHVEAVVGMQWSTGVSLLARLRQENELGQYVVVALGTNGPVSALQFGEMMSVLHGASRVVIVTDHAPDYWEEQNNALFRSEMSRYGEDRIADWDALAKAHPSWLYSDGTHMPIGGVAAYAWAHLVKAQL